MTSTTPIEARLAALKGQFTTTPIAVRMESLRPKPPKH
jgi:hypothetical protein